MGARRSLSFLLQERGGSLWEHAAKTNKDPDYRSSAAYAFIARTWILGWSVNVETPETPTDVNLYGLCPFEGMWFGIPQTDCMLTVCHSHQPHPTAILFHHFPYGQNAGWPSQSLSKCGLTSVARPDPFATGSRCCWFLQATAGVHRPLIDAAAVHNG